MKKYPVTKTARNKKQAEKNFNKGYIYSSSPKPVLNYKPIFKKDMSISPIKTFIISIVFFLLTPTFSYAGSASCQHVKIIFGYKFPPFYIVTSKKEPSKSMHGLFIDMLDKFQAQHPEYDLEYKCLPRARIGKILATGKADAFALSSPMFLCDEINSKYRNSLPLWTVGDYLLVRKNSPLTKSDLLSLTGRTIAVLHGNSYGPLDEYFKKGQLNRHAVYSTSQMLELLLKKRVDAAICNKSTLPGLVKRSGHVMNEFKMLDKPLYTFKLHLMVNREKSGFLHDFNEFIKNTPLPDLQEGG
nr:transporter substrate-binding domain-containing protein [Maridesulfovibrio sp.]